MDGSAGIVGWLARILRIHGRGRGTTNDDSERSWTILNDSSSRYELNNTTTRSKLVFQKVDAVRFDCLCACFEFGMFSPNLLCNHTDARGIT
jgi:hypothetical protein